MSSRKSPRPERHNKILECASSSSIYSYSSANLIQTDINKKLEQKIDKLQEQVDNLQKYAEEKM